MRFSSLLLLCNLGLRAQVWTQLPDFPGAARDDGASALVNNHAFFGTGLRQDFSATNDWYDLNLSTMAWSQIPSMPPGTERQYACAFAGVNSFYVFGGDANGALNDLYMYSLDTKTWTKKASRPGKGVIACACTAVAGKILVFGGKVHHDSLPTPGVWEYDPSNDSWTRKENAPFGGRWRSGMVSLGAFVYVAGGAALPGGSIRKDLWSYDPGTGAWDSLTEIPVTTPVNYASLQAVGNKLVYFGGQDSVNTFYNNTWYYRIAQGDWQAGPPLSAGGRKGGMGLGWNEKFIYTCGLAPGNNRLNETWILDLPLDAREIEEDDFSIYPNPFHGEIFISSKNSGKFFYSVVGSDGREYLSGESHGQFVSKTGMDLAEGLYYLQLRSGQKTHCVRKIVKR